MKNTSMIGACLVTAVVVGSAAFYGGTIYQKSKGAPEFGVGRNRTPMQGQNLQGGSQRNPGTPQMMGRGGAVMGEVTSIDDKTLTVKASDGSSRIVVISGSTTYRISSESSVDKIAIGTKVATFGTSNSDGSTTATSIEINPVMREMGSTTPSPKNN